MKMASVDRDNSASFHMSWNTLNPREVLSNTYRRRLWVSAMEASSDTTPSGSLHDDISVACTKERPWPRAKAPEFLPPAIRWAKRDSLANRISLRLLRIRGHFIEGGRPSM